MWTYRIGFQFLCAFHRFLSIEIGSHHTIRIGKTIINTQLRCVNLKFIPYHRLKSSHCIYNRAGLIDNCLSDITKEVTLDSRCVRTFSFIVTWLFCFKREIAFSTLVMINVNFVLFLTDLLESTLVFDFDALSFNSLHKWGCADSTTLCVWVIRHRTVIWGTLRTTHFGVELSFITIIDRLSNMSLFARYLNMWSRLSLLFYLNLGVLLPFLDDNNILTLLFVVWLWYLLSYSNNCISHSGCAHLSVICNRCCCLVRQD